MAWEPIANLTGPPGMTTVNDLPAGTSLTVVHDDGWPPRPTSRTDITVWWVGGQQAPPGALVGDVHVPEEG